MPYLEREGHDESDSELISHIADYLVTQEAWRPPLTFPLSEMDFSTLAEKLGTEAFQTDESMVISLPKSSASLERHASNTIKLYLPHIVSRQNALDYEFTLTDAFYLEQESGIYLVNPVGRPKTASGPYLVTGVTLDWEQNISPFWRNMGDSPRDVIYTAKKATECAIRINTQGGVTADKFAVFPE